MSKAKPAVHTSRTPRKSGGVLFIFQGLFGRVANQWDWYPDSDSEVHNALSRTLFGVLLIVAVWFAAGCASITEVADLSMSEIVMKEIDGKVSLLAAGHPNPDSIRFGKAATGEEFGVVVQVKLPDGWDAETLRAATL